MYTIILIFCCTLWASSSRTPSGSHSCYFSGWQISFRNLFVSETSFLSQCRFRTVAPFGLRVLEPRRVSHSCYFSGWQISFRNLFVSETSFLSQRRFRTVAPSGLRVLEPRRVSHSCYFIAPLTILAKLSALRLAPPTSAPSMSDWAICSSIVSGLTLPPYKILIASAD